jgi:phosphotransferase system  glucose/maltose/N-acetylglucosamine-specific IIC component
LLSNTLLIITIVIFIFFIMYFFISYFIGISRAIKEARQDKKTDEWGEF